jgi:hypothetical protein
MTTTPTDADIDAIAERMASTLSASGGLRAFARAVLAAQPAPAAPVPVPLTDAFIDDIAAAVFAINESDKSALEHYRALWLESVGRPLARAIERAHGIAASPEVPKP